MAAIRLIDEASAPLLLRGAVMSRTAAGHVQVSVGCDERPDTHPGRSANREASTFTREITGATLVVLDDAGHLPLISRPGAVADALHGFLGPLGPGPERSGGMSCCLHANHRRPACSADAALLRIPKVSSSGPHDSAGAIVEGRRRRRSPTHQQSKENIMASDDKVLINLSHAADHPEHVLTAYLAGVEAVRAGKQAVMFLTMDGVYAGQKGFAETVHIDDAPSIADLHQEYVERGGRFFVCPVCVKTRKLQDAIWADNAEVAGFPSVYEFTDGGALVFNY